MSELKPLTIYELENNYTYHMNDYDRKRIIDKLRHKTREGQEEMIANLKYDKLITENLEFVKHCEVCGRPIDEGYYFEDDGAMYCSNECLEAADMDDRYEFEFNNGTAYWTNLGEDY